MINKTVLKQILASNQKDVENYQVMPRELPSDEFERRVFIGVRRAGKSFMLYQKMQQMLGEASGAEQANSGESLSADFGKQFARLDDSNRQAQAELENYNALQRFLRIHPITKR